MVIAHGFHYRYPKIKEGLLHEEIPVNRWGLLDLDNYPHGTYVLYEGKWYVRSFTSHITVKVPSGVDTFAIETHMVPDEIRTMALLLT